MVTNTGTRRKANAAMGNTHTSTRPGHGSLSQVGAGWWYPWHCTSERARHITYTQGQSDNPRIKEHSSGCT